jgi:diguanylate cyclase (GGDEF)-like protein
MSEQNKQGLKAQLGHGVAHLIDHFVHPSFRVDSDVYFRGRILIAVMLVFAVVMMSAYVVVLNSAFLETSVIYASRILVPATVAFVGLLLLTRRKGLYMPCSLMTVTVLMLMIVYGICVSGGPAISPVLQLLVVPPLTAYFFGGLRWGGYAVSVTFVTLVVLILLHLLGVEFLQTVTTDEQMALAHNLTVCVNLAAVCSMAFIYEATAAVLKRERDTERERYMLLAKTDPLTGLANRRNFDAMLKERIDLYGSQVPPRRFALCYLDLDGFKPINDRYGHAVGDEVLRVISERLRAALRGSDFVGRHGGDEFMLIIDMAGEQAALEAMADRMLNSIAQPIKASVGMVGVTGSLGLAVFPFDAADAHELTKAADAAMYQAKKQRGMWCFYRPGMIPAPE